MATLSAAWPTGTGGGAGAAVPRARLRSGAAAQQRLRGGELELVAVAVLLGRFFDVGHPSPQLLGLLASSGYWLDHGGVVDEPLDLKLGLLGYPSEPWSQMPTRISKNPTESRSP